MPGTKWRAFASLTFSKYPSVGLAKTKHPNGITRLVFGTSPELVTLMRIRWYGVSELLACSWNALWTWQAFAAAYRRLSLPSINPCWYNTVRIHPSWVLRVLTALSAPVACLPGRLVSCLETIFTRMSSEMSAVKSRPSSLRTIAPVDEQWLMAAVKTRIVEAWST